MAFRLRSRADTDPVARAASIQAARQAFSEKEAAKAQKAEKEELRALERENKKREKREESRRRKAQGKEKSGASNEKQATVQSTLYSDVPRASNLANAAASVGGHGRIRRSDTDPSVKSTAKGRWLQFLTWLRTKLFRLGKKVSST